jgi:hypothetical protein
VGSPLQGVVEVFVGGHGELGHHARVRRVSQDIHMDLTTSTSELTIWAITVRRSPRVAKTVKHVPKQGRKAQTVQPITTEPSVGLEGGVGVVIHLSNTRKKQIIISSTEQIRQTRAQKKPPRQHVNSYSDSNRRRSHKTRMRESGAESEKLLNTKVIDNFETFPD